MNICNAIVFFSSAFALLSMLYTTTFLLKKFDKKYKHVRCSLDAGIPVQSDFMRMGGYMTAIILGGYLLKNPRTRKIFDGVNLRDEANFFDKFFSYLCMGGLSLAGIFAVLGLFFH